LILAPDASVSVWLIVRYDPLCYFFLVAAPSHFAHLLKLSKALLIKLFDKFSLLYLGNPDFCYSIRFNNQVLKKKIQSVKTKDRACCFGSKSYVQHLLLFTIQIKSAKTASLLNSIALIVTSYNQVELKG